MKKTWLRQIVVSSLGWVALGYMPIIWAEGNSPGDHLQLPSSIQNLTAVQKQLLEAKQRFNYRAPAERQVLLQKPQQRLNNLSSATKQALPHPAQNEFNNLTPEQKQALLQPKAQPIN